MDCQELAKAQNIYANQLKDLGIVDHIIYEKDSENYKSFPHLTKEIESFIEIHLNELNKISSEQLVHQRYSKYRIYKETIPR